MFANELFIINEADRPHQTLLASKIDKDTLMYVNPKYKKHYTGGFEINSETTTLEDFGFISKYDIKKKDTIFIKTNESHAKYSNGTVRNWQGSLKFSLKDITT